MRNSFLLFLSLVTVPLAAQVRAPERLGNVSVANMTYGFAVLKEGKLNPIEPDCLDSMLRKMTFEQRNAYIINGGSFFLNQANTGEYTLKSVANLKGGGLLGAKIGFWVGKGVVYFVAHTGFLIAAACTGPLAPATYATLVATTAIPLEAASNVGAIAGGIAGGVATGPV